MLINSISRRNPQLHQKFILTNYIMAMSGRLRDLVNYKPMHLSSTVIVFIKQEMGEKKNLVVLIAALKRN